MSSRLKKLIESNREKIETQVADGLQGTSYNHPDGWYIGYYMKNEIKEASTGTLGISKGIRIIDGEYAGDNHYWWDDLERDDAFKWVAGAFQASGIDCDVDDFLKEMEANEADPFGLVEDRVVVKFQLKTTKSKKDGREFQNTYIDKPLPEFEIPEEFINAEAYNEKPKDEAAEEESTDTGANAKSDESADTDSVSDDGEVSLEEGMTIKFKKGKKELEGTIKEIDEENEVLTVTVDGTDHEIGFDAILDVVDPNATA